MIDFRRRANGGERSKATDPIALYDTLDRASDKGPLRPAQQEVLRDWEKSFRSKSDVILKMHTGQGKTIVGLLMLQSKLNESGGTAVYLCPNNYLVDQTCNQAKQFGIRYVRANDDLPSEFLEGRSILITSIQKMFNGLTKFKLSPRHTKVSYIVLDDAHACLDAMRDSCTLQLKQGTQVYADFLQIFENSLRDQGAGTYEEIKAKKSHAYIPVPYWEWYDRANDIAPILAKYSESDSIKFAWPIIKNMLKDCLCIISGSEIVITPYSIPMHMFGSFVDAKHRIFMSATVNDDSFFIKHLAMDADVVRNPLRYSKERWSGERMVLIPSLIDDDYDRTEVVNRFAKAEPGRTKGVVALTPSFEAANFWKDCGAVVASKDDISQHVENLKSGRCDKVVALANRYDGIDLPDDSCRILIIDSKPFSEDLMDRYLQSCRSDSDLLEIRLAQIIEQGIGRNIRGEKDYGVVILTGPTLVQAIQSSSTRQFFSPQTQNQIRIGFEIIEMAREELKSGRKTGEVIDRVIMQCIGRDDGWKDFYTDEMNKMVDMPRHESVIEIFIAERQAADLYRQGQFERAAEKIQELADREYVSALDKAWYLQEKARFLYPQSKIASNEAQKAAHKRNPFLLSPKEGMVVQKISSTGHRRAESVRDYISKFQSYQDFKFHVDACIDTLQFGVAAERFEGAVNELGKILGFSCQQPDREWKKGPDNLWCTRDSEFFIIECKNEVSTTRAEIYKEETGQMNNACAWFDQHYPGNKVQNIMIIPARKIGPGAGFNKIVRIMRPSKLNALRKKVRSFTMEFAGQDIRDLSTGFIDHAIRAHNLEVDTFIQNYTETSLSEVN